MVELMLAMCVFEVGALGLLALTYTSAQGVTSAKNITHATSLARGKLDELVRLPYAHADLNLGAHVEGALNLNAAGTAVSGSTFGANDGNYARAWEVAAPVGGLGFKSVAVRVRWWDLNRRREAAVVVRGGRSEQ